MSLNTFVTCDCCNEEVLPGESYQKRFALDYCSEPYLRRRDLCDACAARIHQTINTYLPNCHWLLEGFEVIK